MLLFPSLKRFPLPLLTCSLALSLTLSLSKAQTSSQTSFGDGLPMLFTENLGQIADDKGQPVPDVLFKAGVQGLDIYVTTSGLSYFFYEQEGSSDDEDLGPGEAEKLPIHWQRIDMNLPGAHLSHDNVEKSEQSALGVNHFYLAHCPDGIMNVPEYGKLTFKDIYPGVDWELYYDSRQGLKYDFIVHPGADPTDLLLAFEGAGDVTLPDDRHLRVSTAYGSVEEAGLLVYQGTPDNRVDARYVQQNDGIGYAFGDYDPDQALVIDPPLTWATYYGGSSLEGPDAITVDATGAVYICGYTSSPVFPLLNPGGGAYYQGTIGGGSFDLIIAKFDVNGIRQWSTYYGGSGSEGLWAALNTTPSGDLILGSYTGSANMPVQGLLGAFNQLAIGGGNDLFFARFNSSGVRQWATFYGGSSNEILYAMDLDDAGNLFAAGYTQSTNFPTTNPGGGAYFQGATGGGMDACIVKFDNTWNVDWATYLGGSGAEGSAFGIYGLGITTAPGLVVVTGRTTSSNFPTQVLGGAYFQGALGGSGDAFICGFRDSGTMLWSTYYGGSGLDEGCGAVFDGFGNIWIMGYTSSANLPTLNSGGGSWFQGSLAGSNDWWFSKFSPAGVQLHASYYGGTGNDAGMGGGTVIRANSVGDIFMTGSSFSTNFPTLNPGGGEYFQGTMNGTRDAAIVQLDNNAVRVWATYYGGNNTDWGSELFIDANDCVYMTGEWISASLVTTLDKGGGAWYQSALAGGHDGYVVQLCPPIVLPQAYLSLTGRQEDGRNVLEWTLHDPPEVTEFVVERSLNGMEYYAIGQVDATGAEAYQFTDRYILPDLNHYRIKGRDANGQISWSNTVTLRSLPDDQEALRDIAPNPAKDRIRLEYYIFESGTPTQIEIFDPTGRRVLLQDLEAAVHGLYVREVDVADLSAGMYLLHFVSGDQRSVRRLLIAD